MPIYKYNCTHCGKLEKNAPLVARNNQDCECGIKLERVITTPSVHFGKGCTKTVKYNKDNGTN